MSSDVTWPPPGCPPLEWPENLDSPLRYEWYASVIEHYALLWADHPNQARIEPVAEEEVVALERRLGTTLPQPLRTYHLRLGALNLAEELRGVGPSPSTIEPLETVFPDVGELGIDPAVTRDMIVFAEGGAKLVCYHRRSGEVHHLNPDSDEPLARFFDDIDAYLEAVMIRCLAEIHDAEDPDEQILTSRLGRELVRHWLY